MTPLIESLENARSLKIHFKTDFKEGECLKLVFASDELSRAAEEGDGICFKGTEGKLDAVICTSTKTFRLKKVETSNSVLVVPPTQIRFNGRYEVMAKASYYYETVSLKPIFDGLMAALKQSEYRGYDNERSIPSGDLLLYTERELGEMILCSEEELCRMLKIIGAINIDGYVRLCSPKVLHDLNGTLINTIIEKDWDVNNISWSECVAEIPDVDLVILDYTLSRLGEKNIDGRTWALSHINLARAVAHLIFNETEKGIPHFHFQKSGFQRHRNFVIFIPQLKFRSLCLYGIQELQEVKSCQKSFCEVLR